jgi:hypothetical protein
MTRAKLYFSEDKDRYHELLEMVILRDDLSKNIDQIRDKYEVETSLSGYGDGLTMRQIIWLPEDKRLMADVRNMLTGLKISRMWLKPMVSYILDTLYKDDTNVVKNPNGVTLQIDPVDPNKILLKLGPRATFTDVKKAWDIVKKLRENTPRNKPRLNAERDLKVLTMFKKGLSLTEICYQLDKEYRVKNTGKNIGDGFTENYVRKIIMDAHKRCGLNTPKLA